MLAGIATWAKHDGFQVGSYYAANDSPTLERHFCGARTPARCIILVAPEAGGGKVVKAIANYSFIDLGSFIEDRRYVGLR